MRLFEDLPHPPRPPRWLLPVTIPILVAMVVATNVGNVMIPHWAETHPRWLLALNTRSTIALLVSPHIDSLSYYGIGMARLLSSDPFLFAIGYFYGDGVLRWVERKLGEDGYTAFRWTEKLFHAARWPMVAIAPNNIICLLAGATRMAWVPFVVLNVVGSAVRLWAMRAFGNNFTPFLTATTGFLGRWRWPISAVLLGIVVLQWWMQRKGNGGAIGDLRDIAAEQAQADEADRTGGSEVDGDEPGRPPLKIPGSEEDPE